MKRCSICKKLKPLSDFYLKKNGRPISQCKVCKREYTRDYNQIHPRRTINTVFSVDSYQVRHPDNAVMRADVDEKAKYYHEAEQKLKQAHLPFVPEAGLVDMILKGI